MPLIRRAQWKVSARKRLHLTLPFTDIAMKLSIEKMQIRVRARIFGSRRFLALWRFQRLGQA
jgi:hypothetical protein